MVDKKVLKKPAPVEVTEKVAPPKAAVKPAAPLAKAVAKAAETAKEVTRKVGVRKYGDNQVITLLVDYNPKRVGSAANRSFDCYEDGMTVAAFLAAGGLPISLSWDSAHGYIKIGDEFDEDAEKKSKPEPKPKAEPKPKKVKAEAEAGEEEEEAEEQEAE